jgi:hypothetical protein
LDSRRWVGPASLFGEVYGLNPAKAQMDQVQRFAEKLRRWEDERFYGEVTLRLKDGQIRMVEVKQTEVWDQAAGGG